MASELEQAEQGLRALLEHPAAGPDQKTIRSDLTLILKEVDDLRQQVGRLKRQQAIDRETIKQLREELDEAQA